MAAAALERLALQPAVVEVLEPHVMLPQVGQGALAVECRADDGPTIGRLAAVDHPATWACVEAERGFLARLGGGCSLPVGAHATLGAGDELHIEAMLASLDGRSVLRATALGPRTDGPEMGAGLAEKLLGSGGAAILADAGLALP